jgi:2-polyprenyl-6-methoxyphenol hydroxylase-like FAD-dependent oxidoreductase
VRIAVVGGGVGGLTAAVALVRAGAEVTVLEQSPQVTAVGASLQLGPNATRLLDDLGLLDRLRAVASRPDAVDLLRWDDGSLLLHARHGDAAEEYFGAPQLDFFRPDLQRALVAALPPGVLRLGARVVAADDDGVVLEGGERIRADGVVAADGIRSPLRQQLVGVESPAFSGTVTYRGVISREAAGDLHPDKTNRYWIGPYRHGVSYWISGGTLLALNLGVQRVDWSEESWTREVDAAEADAYLDGWDEALRERVRRCERMLRGGVFVRQPIEHWTYGRVTLLGDAAHAMEPFQAQGAAQAVEDAYVLGACVASAGDDVESAFRRYERIRMDRAAELQTQARDAGFEFFLEDGPEQRERDERFRALAETQPFGTRQRVWEYDVRTALPAPSTPRS